MHFEDPLPEHELHEELQDLQSYLYSVPHAPKLHVPQFEQQQDEPQIFPLSNVPDPHAEGLHENNSLRPPADSCAAVSFPECKMVRNSICGIFWTRAKSFAFSLFFVPRASATILVEEASGGRADLTVEDESEDEGEASPARPASASSPCSRP